MTEKLSAMELADMYERGLWLDRDGKQYEISRLTNGLVIAGARNCTRWSAGDRLAKLSYARMLAVWMAEMERRGIDPTLRFTSRVDRAQERCKFCHCGAPALYMMEWSGYCRKHKPTNAMMAASPYAKKQDQARRDFHTWMQTNRRREKSISPIKARVVVK